MNTVLLAVMSLLVLFALSQGMLWVALGVVFTLAVAWMVDSRSVTPEKGPMLYQAPARKAPRSGPKTRDMFIKYQDDWDGHDIDLWFGDMVAEHWGGGIGRGLGLLK